MKAIETREMRAVEGGYSTTCPTCGKKVTVGFFDVLFLGKATAYKRAQENARAKHWNYSGGYVANVKHY